MVSSPQPPQFTHPHGRVAVSDKATGDSRPPTTGLPSATAALVGIESFGPLPSEVVAVELQMAAAAMSSRARAMQRTNGGGAGKQHVAKQERRIEAQCQKEREAAEAKAKESADAKQEHAWRNPSALRVTMAEAAVGCPRQRLSTQRLLHSFV